ncbi:MAG: RsmD family RNA methyltransferase [bacterium]
MASPRQNPTVKIEALDDEGRGLARVDGKNQGVAFAIPGETWRLQPKPELVEASPDRVPPPCPYFGRCGGCQLQHMKAARQAEEKDLWLRRVLRGLVPEERILPLIRSPREWNYRRRIQLHVGPRGEIGFYAAKSREVVDIQSCRIAEEALNRQLPSVRKTALQALQGPKKPASLSYELTLCEDGSVEIVPGGAGRSFLQVNPEANCRLIEVLRAALEEIRPQRVLELFAGDGNLGLALATPGQQWLAVESNPRAVERGRGRGSDSGVALEWKQGEAAKVAAQLFQGGARFDAVLLDPPRGGAEDCLPLFRKYRPPHLLYVSCHAPVLRKDLQVLVKAGYEVAWVQALDFFPQTMNLEAAVALRFMPHSVKG